MDNTRQILNVPNKIAVFCDRHRDAGNICLLERIGSDQAGNDVPRYDNERNGIHKRRGDPRHRIGRSRSGGGDTYADFASGSGVPVRRVDGALLMSGQQVVEIGKSVQRVINVQHRSARITKDALDTFQKQAAKQDIRTCNDFRFHPFFS
ncbi:hypothetical protein D3C81_1475460 [compost metagenome]